MHLLHKPYVQVIVEFSLSRINKVYFISIESQQKPLEISSTFLKMYVFFFFALKKKTKSKKCGLSKNSYFKKNPRH